MEPSSRPRVTVVITTHHRVNDAILAVDSCLTQSEPCEVLVFDDASPDHTTDVLRSRFPSIRVIRSEIRVGYIGLRNRGFQEATGDIVVSIDDDAIFSSPETLARVVEAMDRYPQAAALALAFVEPYSDREKMPPQPAGTRLRTYIGCAHAIRREVALQAGGYAEFLVHQGEERDLTIRLIEAGYDVVYADTPPIMHFYSSKRDHFRVNYYGYRNTILFAWMRIPFPECLLRAVLGTVQLLCYRFSFRTLGTRIPALIAGWWGIISHRQARQPVSRSTYRRFRSLPMHGPIALSESDQDHFRQLADRIHNQSHSGV